MNQSSIILVDSRIVAGGPGHKTAASHRGHPPGKHLPRNLHQIQSEYRK